MILSCLKTKKKKVDKKRNEGRKKSTIGMKKTTKRMSSVSKQTQPSSEEHPRKMVGINASKEASSSPREKNAQKHTPRWFVSIEFAFLKYILFLIGENFYKKSLRQEQQKSRQ